MYLRICRLRLCLWLLEQPKVSASWKKLDNVLPSDIVSWRRACYVIEHGKASEGLARLSLRVCMAWESFMQSSFCSILFQYGLPDLARLVENSFFIGAAAVAREERLERHCAKCLLAIPGSIEGPHKASPSSWEISAALQKQFPAAVLADRSQVRLPAEMQCPFHQLHDIAHHALSAGPGDELDL